MSLDLTSNNHQNNLKAANPSDSVVYEFEDFRLNAGKLMLYRKSGEEISLTPKQVETLLALVERGGEIVGKDELMKRVWADAFVEESNLVQNIYILRKTLGATACGKPMIETLRRRGYRFNGELQTNGHSQEIAAEQLNGETISALKSPAIVGDSATADKTGAAVLPRKKRTIAAIAIFATLAIAAVSAASWYALKGKSGAPILSAPFDLEKISTNGKVHHAVISPDGANVFYVNGSPNDKQSLWLRQIETGNNVEIIPASDDLYFGLAISPDEKFLYFSRRPRAAAGQTDIYRVSIFGGVPQKIIGEAQGWISISPDGAKISFVRCYYRDDEYCSLWIADAADGKNERKLASRPSPFRIADNEISPDGKRVAFAAGQSRNGANDFGLFEIDIETGAERELTAEKFFVIANLAPLPGAGGWLITARKNDERNFRIRHVAATGAIAPLTSDAENYATLSLSRDASRLIATQFRMDFRLRISNLEDATVKRDFGDTHSAFFAPDGKIIVWSSMSGNPDIWSINADGSERLQLTNDAADEHLPIVSPDGATIFFASNRTGDYQVWRMNRDGSNQTRVTNTDGGFPLFAAPDGKWVYFQHNVSRTLWRVPPSGGEASEVFNSAQYRFAFAPDGSRFAFAENQDAEKFIAVAALADGQIVKKLKIADPQAKVIEIAFAPDGKSLFYVLLDNNSRSNFLYQHRFDEPLPRRVATLGEEQLSEVGGFALAPDGATYAVIQGGWRHDAVLLNGLK
jgi:Tol biopolymer transport system component/DNA-binding winged helix-turn-helix (wHTH) protein